MISFPRLSQFPDDARLWLYVANRLLSAAESALIQERLGAFMEQWSSHGRAVQGAAEIAESRVVGIAALIPDGDVSGCGIDKSVHELDALGSELGVDWQSGLAIAYRGAGGDIAVTTRPQFRAAGRSGDVGPDTHVIDLAATTVAQLHDIEKPASESWHARVFGLRASDVPA